MTTLTLVKRLDGSFVPATHQDAEKCERVKIGTSIRGEWKRPRNTAFHRKYFALLNIGYEAFEPVDGEYKGLPAQKNFDRFRKDVVCAAGFYDVVTNLNGDVPRRTQKHQLCKDEPGRV